MKVWDYIREIILVFLAIMGMVWLVKQLILLIFKDDKDTRYNIIILIKNHNEDIEFTVRCVATRLKWSGTKLNNIICLDCGTDNETLDICRTLSKDMPFIKVTDKSNLSSIIE